MRDDIESVALGLFLISLFVGLLIFLSKRKPFLKIDGEQVSLPSGFFRTQEKIVNLKDLKFDLIKYPDQRCLTFFLENERLQYPEKVFEEDIEVIYECLLSKQREIKG